MKSAILRSKSILLTICFILMVGTFVSAQQTTSSDGEKSTLAQTSAPVSEEEKKKFYNLSLLATAALDDGESEKAKAYAETLLKQAETLPSDWNYGNAVHVGNLVLGHLALAAGEMKEAKSFLLAAGKTPGSPQLNSFGPNMRLAKALLEKGEKEVVLEYFDLCAKFWKPQFSRTTEWKAVVQKDEIPDFGANLLYQFAHPRVK
jgi:hypothetical protein